MSMPALLLLLAWPARGADWFYPGPGPERVELDAAGRIGGMAVGRSGAVLLRVEDPAILDGLQGLGRVERLGGDGRVLRIQLAPGQDDFAIARLLHERPGVAWAHPDLVLPTTLNAAPEAGLPDDPLWPEQWHLENTGQNGWTPGADIDAPGAWALASGAGGLVAVIDSGVDLSHPDLDLVSGWDYVDDDADSSPGTDDSAPHGTAAAGLAAAIGDNGLGVAGVAYGARVYGIRLIDGSTSLSDLYDAFAEAVDAGAGVLSNSWGFDNGCASFPTYGSLSDALQYAELEGRGGLGTVVVVAAGNGDCDIGGDGFQAPGTVLSVAAVNGADARESYSSFGAYVDLAAPSGGLLTTDIVGAAGYGDYNGDGDYMGWFSGTSAAAPLVSGTVALMLEANPRLSAAQVREVLRQTAVPIDLEGEYADGAGYDAEGWNPYYGFGRLDAGAAVLAVANTAPLAPVLLDEGIERRVDRVLLRWEPGLDADEDVLATRISWQVDEGEIQVQELQGQALDLTGQVEQGAVLRWWAEAIDPWGPSPASPAQEFELLPVATAPAPAPIEETGGCQQGPGLPMGLPWGLVLLPALLRGRLRRRAGARSGGCPGSP